MALLTDKSISGFHCECELKFSDSVGSLKEPNVHQASLICDYYRKRILFQENN